jgi:hypothetical protein
MYVAQSSCCFSRTCRSFLGYSAEGINRELATTLESAAFCRKFKSCKSLAIPETGILKLANSLPDNLNRESNMLRLISSSNLECSLSWWEIARGILPSLRYIVERDCSEMELPFLSNRVDAADLPDTHPDSLQLATDPFGNDYFCKTCSYELANTYFHCVGCESLLAKDFNICIECHNDKAFLTNVEMHGRATAMTSQFHHLGAPRAWCNCSSIAQCPECRTCLSCLCSCHTKFQKRRRFYTEEQQWAMLARCAKAVKGAEVLYATETECRLHGETMISPKMEKPLRCDVTEEDADAATEEKSDKIYVGGASGKGELNVFVNEVNLDGAAFAAV